MAEHSPDPEVPAVDVTATRPRRRLRHRLPVRLRHYWKTAAVTVAGALALVLVFGGSTVRPYITSDLVAEEAITHNVAGKGDLFDAGEHSIKITYDQTEYDEMMETFEDEGEKEFIEADLTIDGTLIKDVGLRLKGNSTLMSLRGDKGSMQIPEGVGKAPEGKDESAPQGKQAPDGGDGGADGDGARPAGMAMTQLSKDEPAELPWLISFDEFHEGRAYQGHTQVVLRPAAGGSDAALNEALALEMSAQAGQTTQDFTFTSVSVNGGKASARLLVDAPDPAWATSLGEGVLYKARAGGSLEYLGEDPTDYEESFNQINADGSYDLQPVINLLRFVNRSDDDEFADELDEHLDVEAFAEYLATQEILQNQDAMDGPGNNYYLWYDTEDQRFTVLSWDLNLSMSEMGMGMGGEMPEGMPGNIPEGMPEGMPEDLPEGMPEMPQDGDLGGIRAGGSGLLKERFLEVDEFKALYEEAYADLFGSVVKSGFAAGAVQDLADRARAAGDTKAGTAASTLEKQLTSLTEEPPDPKSSAFGRTRQVG